ncbi:MAG TPA: tetratricopeptide repeat protein [Polyangiaceae bacterium]|nr:tetratricopeptide repeat protein [Polyangiaceae bacterium]
MRVAPFAVAAALAINPGFLAPPAEAQESQIGPLRAAAAAAAAKAGGDPAASVALGRALRRAGRWGEAQAELRRGGALAAGRPDAQAQVEWEVARVYMDRHDFPQALAACRALGRIRGAGADGHACAADAHLVWQRATEALTETAAALGADAECYEARVAEGRAYDFALDEARSEASFRAAIARRPEGAEAHLGLGRVLLKVGRRDEALRELRRAVELDPDGPDVLFELATALGPGDESAALLERATRERPSFSDAWIALGRQRLTGGRLADAKKAAEAAARTDAKDVAPHVLLGQVALADGHPDDARKEGEAALRILANSAAAKLLVADADAKQGDIDRALEAYQAAWGLDHGDPTPLVHAAEACHAAGRDTSARAFALKTTQEFPRWGPGWAALGDALVGQGEKRAARDAYTSALTAEGPVDRDGVRRKLAALP